MDDGPPPSWLCISPMFLLSRRTIREIGQVHVFSSKRLIWCLGGGQEEDGKDNGRFPGEEEIRVAQSRLASGLGNKAVQHMILAFVRYVGYVKW